MTPRLYIFRHAVATRSRAGYGSQIKTAEILPEGVPPIKKLANYLKTVESDYHASSEYLRCRQTASIVTEVTGKQFIFDSRLNEFDNEKASEFISRVSDFLEDIKTKNYKSSIICTHAGVIAVILKTLKGEEIFDDDLLTNYPLPGVLVMVENSIIKEINFNEG